VRRGRGADVARHGSQGSSTDISARSIHTIVLDSNEWVRSNPRKRATSDPDGFCGISAWLKPPDKEHTTSYSGHWRTDCDFPCRQGRCKSYSVLDH